MKKIVTNGFETSQFVYGIWRLLDDPKGSGAEVIKDKIDACLEVGIDTIDSADLYGDYKAEIAFGEFLKKFPDYKSKLKIITKCGIQYCCDTRPETKVKYYDYSPEYIRFSVEQSLEKLNVESLDCLLFHRPSPLMNAKEVAKISHVLKQEGKVKYFGVSNFTPSQYTMLASEMELVTNQVEANPLQLTSYLDGTFDQCQERGISPMIWSPLAGGRIFSPKSEREVRVREKLGQLAEKYQVDLDVLAYSWLLRHPTGPIVILGTSNPERILKVRKTYDVNWDIQDWFDLWSSSTGEEVP